MPRPLSCRHLHRARRSSPRPRSLAACLRCQAPLVAAVAATTPKEEALLIDASATNGDNSSAPTGFGAIRVLAAAIAGQAHARGGAPGAASRRSMHCRHQRRVRDKELHEQLLWVPRPAHVELQQLFQSRGASPGACCFASRR
jgi:hypothetical protein